VGAAPADLRRHPAPVRGLVRPVVPAGEAARGPRRRDGLLRPLRPRRPGAGRGSPARRAAGDPVAGDDAPRLRRAAGVFPGGAGDPLPGSRDVARAPLPRPVRRPRAGRPVDHPPAAGPALPPALLPHHRRDLPHRRLRGAVGPARAGHRVEHRGARAPVGRVPDGGAAAPPGRLRGPGPGRGPLARDAHRAARTLGDVRPRQPGARLDRGAGAGGRRGRRALRAPSGPPRPS
jgi:hypothetical protein